MYFQSIKVSAGADDNSPSNFRQSATLDGVGVTRAGVVDAEDAAGREDGERLIDNEYAANPAVAVVEMSLDSYCLLMYIN